MKEEIINELMRINDGRLDDMTIGELHWIVNFSIGLIEQYCCKEKLELADETGIEVIITAIMIYRENRYE